MTQKFKILPTPTFKNKFFNKKSINNQIAEMLEKILNEETRNGWEFVDIKTVLVPKKKSFFNSSGEEKVSLLIFKKNNNSLTSTNELKVTNDKFPSLGPATKD